MRSTSPNQLLDQRVLATTAPVAILQPSTPTEVESLRLVNIGAAPVTVSVYHDPSGSSTFTAATWVADIPLAATSFAVLEGTSSPVFGAAPGQQIAVAASIANVVTVTTYGRVYRGLGGPTNNA